MKKRLLTFLISAGMFFLANAQVGINIPPGTQPKATLQINGNPQNKNVLDGILIPKISLLDLMGKTVNYATNPDYEGAMVFISDLSGITGVGGIYSQITQKGMYYLDTTKGLWLPLAPPTTTPVKKNLVRIRDTDYKLTPDDDVLIFSGTHDMKLTLPEDDSIPIGKTIYVSAGGIAGTSAGRVVLNSVKEQQNIIENRSGAILTYTGEGYQDCNKDQGDTPCAKWSRMNGF